jgi:lipoprotein NlpD
MRGHLLVHTAVQRAHASVIGVLCATVLVGCTSTAPAPIVHRNPSTETSDTKREFYTVGRGDTLTAIGQRFGVSTRDLIEWNSLGATPVLQAGQVLRVAQAPRSVAQAPVVAAPAPVPESGVQTGAVKPPTVVSAPVEPARTAIKTGPKGLKRPYSDDLYAQMAKGPVAEAPVPVPSTAVVPAVAAPTPAPTAGASDVKTDSAGTAWSWPSGGKLMQGFDGTRSRGLTMSGEPGKPVFAAAKGKVIFAKEYLDFGKLVIIQHGNDLVSVYANNNSISVKEQQQVERGQKIAEQGPRVQFEIRRSGKAVDPMPYLPQR